jgi:hypothetical protein
MSDEPNAFVPPWGEVKSDRKLEELIAEQGVAETATFERLLGGGVDLWDDDADFEAFLARMRAIRQEKG